MKKQPWSFEHEQYLKEAVSAGRSSAEIAEALGRSINSVNNKREALHLVKPVITAIGNTTEQPKPDPTNVEILRLERELSVTRQELKTTTAKLSAVHREEALFQALAAEMRTCTIPLPTPHIPPPAKKDKQATDCDMVLLLSDEHADETVSHQVTWGLERFDFNVFRCRIERLAKLVRDYATLHLPKHHFERLWVFKLGDGVNGGIHGAGLRNHFQNTIKAAVALGDVEAQFVESLVPFFARGVHVVGISGNHPRTTLKKEYAGPTDNFDYLVGTQIATRLAGRIDEGLVSVTLPESWSAYVKVRNGLWALNHGDDITSYTGLPWVGFDRRNNRVQAALVQAKQHVDFFAYGHYHTPAEFPSAGALSFHNGAFPGTDPFAIGRLAIAREPQQNVYVVDDSPGMRGLILPIPMYLREESRERDLQAGAYEPALGRHLVLQSVLPPVSDSFQVIDG